MFLFRECTGMIGKQHHHSCIAIHKLCCLFIPPPVFRQRIGISKTFHIVFQCSLHCFIPLLTSLIFKQIAAKTPQSRKILTDRTIECCSAKGNSIFCLGVPIVFSRKQSCNLVEIFPCLRNFQLLFIPLIIQTLVFDLFKQIFSVIQKLHGKYIRHGIHRTIYNRKRLADILCILHKCSTVLFHKRIQVFQHTAFYNLTHPRNIHTVNIIFPVLTIGFDAVIYLMNRSCHNLRFNPCPPDKIWNQGSNRFTAWTFIQKHTQFSSRTPLSQFLVPILVLNWRYQYPAAFRCLFACNLVHEHIKSRLAYICVGQCNIVIILFSFFSGRKGNNFQIAWFVAIQQIFHSVNLRSNIFTGSYYHIRWRIQHKQPCCAFGRKFLTDLYDLHITIIRCRIFLDQALTVCTDQLVMIKAFGIAGKHCNPFSLTFIRTQNIINRFNDIKTYKITVAVRQICNAKYNPQPFLLHIMKKLLV